MEQSFGASLKTKKRVKLSYIIRCGQLKPTENNSAPKELKTNEIPETLNNMKYNTVIHKTKMASVETQMMFM